MNSAVVCKLVKHNKNVISMWLKNLLKKRKEIKYISEVREFIFSNILDNAVGFKKDKGVNSLIRNTEYGKDYFVVSVTKIQNVYNAELFSYKKFEDLEKIYYEFTTAKKFKVESLTIGGQLGLLLDRPLPFGYKAIPNYDFWIDNLYDLEKATKKIVELFKKTEEVFFQKFNTYQELYEITNNDPINMGRYDYGTYIHKALLGTTLSKILEDENYDTIVEIYRNKVARILPEELSSYEGLLKKLEL